MISWFGRFKARRQYRAWVQGPTDKRQFVESPVAGDRHSRLYMSSGMGSAHGRRKEYVLGITAPEDSPLPLTVRARGHLV